MIHYRLLILWIGIIIFLFISGCTEETTNVPDENNGLTDNHPPQILLWGPEFDSLTEFNGYPKPWVIIGDVDGSDDITAVILKISKIDIVSLIVRPDDSTQECSMLYYAPYDTIDVTHYLSKQTFSVPFQVMSQIGNGIYTNYLTFSMLTEGGIVNDADVFGEPVKPCVSGQDYPYWIEHFGLYPPAVPVPRDVYLTFAKLFISGLSIVVYDQSGASDSITFPDFYGSLSNIKEDQTLP